MRTGLPILEQTFIYMLLYHITRKKTIEKPHFEKKRISSVTFAAALFLPKKIKSSDDRFACVRCCAEAVFRKYFILRRDFLFIQFAAQDLAHTYIK